MKSSSVRVLFYALPILFLLLVSLIFRVTNFDIDISSLFYSPNNGWAFGYIKAFNFIANKMLWLPYAMLFISIFIFSISFFYKKFYKYRKICFFIILAAGIGTGCIVNLVFKQYYGRPRPRDVQEFKIDGYQSLKVLTIGEYIPDPHRFNSLHSKQGKLWDIAKKVMVVRGTNVSFPSGHAAFGFLMMLPAFLFLHRYRKRAYMLYSLGVVYGGTIGSFRIMLGAHFTTDIMWAWGFMHITILTLYYLLKMDKNIFLAPKEKLT